MNFTRRRIGAIALIVAGIGAFLVPFLLHSPTTPSTTSNNNNNGNNSHTTTTTTPSPTPTTTTTTNDNHGSDSGGGTTGSTGCTTKSDDSDEANETSDAHTSQVAPDNDHNANSHKGDSPEGHAYGLLKNQLDTTISLVKTMGSQNPAFHSHHSTDTDNDTVNAHAHHMDADSSTGSDSSCPDSKSGQDD